LLANILLKNIKVGNYKVVLEDIGRYVLGECILRGERRNRDGKNFQSKKFLENSLFLKLQKKIFSEDFENFGLLLFSDSLLSNCIDLSPEIQN